MLLCCRTLPHRVQASHFTVYLFISPHRIATEVGWLSKVPVSLTPVGWFGLGHVWSQWQQSPKQNHYCFWWRPNSLITHQEWNGNAWAMCNYRFVWKQRQFVFFLDVRFVGVVTAMATLYQCHCQCPLRPECMLPCGEQAAVAPAAAIQLARHLSCRSSTWYGWARPVCNATIPLIEPNRMSTDDLSTQDAIAKHSWPIEQRRQH